MPFTAAQTTLFVWGSVAHYAADWFLQNHWMATTKADLRKSGGYVHAGLHGLCALLVFPWPYALALTVAHLLIDTRKPLEWWGRLVGQSTPEQAGPAYIPFAFGRDQAAHFLCIALAAYLSGR